MGLLAQAEVPSPGKLGAPQILYKLHLPHLLICLLQKDGLPREHLGSHGEMSISRESKSWRAIFRPCVPAEQGCWWGCWGGAPALCFASVAARCPLLSLSTAARHLPVHVHVNPCAEEPQGSSPACRIHSCRQDLTAVNHSLSWRVS